LDRRNRIFIPLMLVVALVAVAGCKKKMPPPPAATAPRVVAPAPTAKITASPDVVTAGEQVVLTWSTTNAASVSLEGYGEVPTSGTKTVIPNSSTNYQLIAKGEGGTAEASVRVTVHAAPAVVANTVNSDEEFKTNVKDIFFNYDKYEVRSDAQATLANDAAYLKSHPAAKILIGGYCDERGSNEYNLALGQKRADSAKRALIAAGVDASRIRVISYGKEKPFCTESTEACWQLNRRAGFTPDH
jgi:peptidoglycan-associated lipoprotein